jgi:hypothetical protein
MVDTALVPAVREAIKQNELGNQSPYQLSYARLGASGASFGIFQGDTNVNHVARATLLRALQGANADGAAVARIMAAVSQPCPNGDPLTSADSAIANQALSSPAGRALVDGMDASLLQVVLGELDSCIAAAATARGHTIEGAALLCIALWVNMTGAPDTLNKWLGGTQEVGLAPPTGPVVTRHNLESYLQANTYFRLHPRNFVHLQDSVNAALPLLPGG